MKIDCSVCLCCSCLNYGRRCADQWKILVEILSGLREELSCLHTYMNKVSSLTSITYSSVLSSFLGCVIHNSNCGPSCNRFTSLDASTVEAPNQGITMTIEAPKHSRKKSTFGSPIPSSSWCSTQSLVAHQSFATSSTSTGSFGSICSLKNWSYESDDACTRRTQPRSRERSVLDHSGNSTKSSRLDLTSSLMRLPEKGRLACINNQKNAFRASSLSTFFDFRVNQNMGSCGCYWIHNATLVFMFPFWTACKNAL